MACDDDDAIELSGRAGFVEQRDIHEEPSSRHSGISGQGSPARTDGGVEDVFKLLSKGIIAEDDVPEFFPIRASGGVANARTECGNGGVANRIIRPEQVMHMPVGVEML